MDLAPLWYSSPASGAGHDDRDSIREPLGRQRAPLELLTETLPHWRWQLLVDEAEVRLQDVLARKPRPDAAMELPQFAILCHLEIHCLEDVVGMPQAAGVDLERLDALGGGVGDLYPVFSFNAPCLQLREQRDVRLERRRGEALGELRDAGGQGVVRRGCRQQPKRDKT